MPTTTPLAAFVTAVALAATGCAGTVMYEDTKPIVVSVQPPELPREEEPPPPKRVAVEADRIEVKEQIFFATGSARIVSESFGLLDEIATVITDHPELLTIRIEGHTDAIGGSRTNLSLSKKRAASVRTYLVSKGVEATRLTSEGYGLDNPIASNDTEEGRAKNRRVAFTVLDREDDKDDDEDDEGDEDDLIVADIGGAE